jgi:chemotaxis protein MotB
MSSRPGGDAKKVIIIKKKKKGHEGHHGGSWKVAYADFVTAMMAFFLVMWIMSMDQGVKDLVQGYFQNPVGFKRTFSGGTNPLAAGNFVKNMDIKRTVILNRRQQEERFKSAAAEIQDRIDQQGIMNGLDAEVEIVVTDEGLRIELMETGRGEVFFDKASSLLKPSLKDVLGVVGGVLEAFPGEIVIEGHTDALRYGGVRYSNWELSVDRANAARRAMEAGGLEDGRITEVRGYADRQPKVGDAPDDPRNRRISVLLPFEETSLETLHLPDTGLEAALRELGSSGPGAGG